MSTPPRDAGIPMLTEVINDADMELSGPPELVEPLSEAEQQAAGILDAEEAQAAVPHEAPAQEPALAPPAAAPATSPQPQATPEPAFAQPQPQSAPAYPIPLKPAAAAAPAALAPRAVPGPAAPPIAGPARAETQPSSMDDEEWQRMERRVRERILGQLLSRTDAMLEERIRAGLTGVVEQAVEGLAASLRLSLHKTLEDVVSRAVAQEITRLQSSKK
ncbi:hypothetical protein KTQ42_09720|uniref:hypothetical protein n=1 Tax=Noviherbaspirillum sp. L7-7A TaxID=2850560 RepID=UPI001C2C1BE0|nr:hypothetical protein [Noviherbaspirillum sp. L7-7A]MBV0879578.1 hypothetical protein [Noviherbaspirillum sp. L7-7A]